MKKSYLVLLVTVLFSMSIFSQENREIKSTSGNFNELKLNGLYLILGAFDVTYERTINQESAFGVNVFLPFDDDINDDINYYISPYYRFYFGKKYAAGFFIEGFGMLNSINESRFSGTIDPVIKEETITDFALGIGLGGKWITESGFIGELNFGVGRNLFNSDRNNDFDFVAKIGITVGYRF